MSTAPDLSTTVSGVVLVLLADYLAQHRAWGWVRLVQGPAAFRDVPGLLFVKVMGSGHGGGFGLRPSGSHQGLICVFKDIPAATAFIQGEHVRGVIEHSREHWLGLMAATSARGTWDQQSWDVTPSAVLEHFAVADGGTGSGHVVASITRGTIRPAKALAFWRYSPPAQADLAKAKGCLLAMGLGEAPLVRQCTFSLWESTEAMTTYAHSGAHKQAVAAAYKNDYFAESMFVRMRVLAMSGTWQGRGFELATEDLQHV